MLRAIREIQPRWVVGENVFGIVNWNGGMVFDEVQADLEAQGYEVQPYVLPAAGVNAPHRRDRVWFVAYSKERNDGRATGEDEGKGKKERVSERNEVRKPIKPGEVFGDATHSNDTRTDNTLRDNGNRKAKDKGWQGQPQPEFRKDGIDDDVAYSDNKGLEGGASQRIQTRKRGKNRNKIYESSWGVQGTWETFPTQSPVCNGDDGIPTYLDGITFPKWRNESIKAGGNAIVPQVALEIFKAIEKYETTTH